MQSLTYSPNVVKVGFADISSYNNVTFADESTKTPAQNIEMIFELANSCRDWYTPAFANESKFLPTKKDINITTPNVIEPIELPNSVKDLTIVPNIKDDTLIKGIIIGVGICVLIKILS